MSGVERHKLPLGKVTALQPEYQHSSLDKKPEAATRVMIVAPPPRRPSHNLRSFLQKRRGKNPTPGAKDCFKQLKWGNGFTIGKVHMAVEHCVMQ